jgi:hypothetical protein
MTTYFRYLAAIAIAALLFGFATMPNSIAPIERAHANNVYYDFSGGNLTLLISASTTNLITANDNWSGVPSIEGYEGRDLTNPTEGVDPQTVLTAEFASSQLPNSPTQVNANKGNPSAYNAGGLTEFDAGPEYAIGFQGNVHANPYMIFYLNTTGHSAVTMSYEVTDIDGGSNSSNSPIALQYRIGETGNFTNIPAGYIADATDGPTISGRVTYKNLTLPAACSNQAKVQIRLITTNGAGPDEWVGVNNVVISVLGPTAASGLIGGQVTTAEGMPISRTQVTLTGLSGQSVSTLTNSFGFYAFDGIELEQTYVVEVRSRRYTFSQPTQVIYAFESIKSIDFQAAPNFWGSDLKKSFFKR